jgi:hypothetical protein
MTDVVPLLAPVRAIFDELTQGASGDAAWVLNPQDAGLLASLDRLDAQQASATPANGGASIAAHADHVRYGLELLNRWQRGEEPFESADWTQSWNRPAVTTDQWAALRASLRREVEAWRLALQSPRDMSDVPLTGIVAGVVHLAYHLGAMRQIDRTLRGPAAPPLPDHQRR